MNVARLIEEVRIRPTLWDLLNVENKSRTSIPNLWKEVANAVGVDDVEQCKRKWKNLRDAYRALVRRSERRIERDKLLGEYNPNKEYDSKWVFYDALTFIKDNKRRRRRYSLDHDQNTNSTDDPQFNSSCHIKSEPTRSRDDDVYSIGDDDDDDDDDNNDMDDDIFFEEFESVAAPPQPTVSLMPMATMMAQSLPSSLSTKAAASAQPLPLGDTNATDNNHCKCSKRSEKHVHFLEDLGQEEQKLMHSTQHDMKHSKDHTGDSDYNFLISFLPQMKKMGELQNLQFRARMCEMVLNILAPSIATRSRVPPPLTAGPAVAQLEFRKRTDIILPQQQQSAIFPCIRREGKGAENLTINAATSTTCSVVP